MKFGILILALGIWTSAAGSEPNSADCEAQELGVHHQSSLAHPIIADDQGAHLIEQQLQERALFQLAEGRPAV